MASACGDHSDDDDGVPLFFAVMAIVFFMVMFVFGLIWDPRIELPQYFTRTSASEFALHTAVANLPVLFALAYLINPELKDWPRYRRRSAYVAAAISDASVMLASYWTTPLFAVRPLAEFGFSIAVVVLCFGIAPCLALARVAVHRCPGLRVARRGDQRDQRGAAGGRGGHRL